jgi:putative flippase GtrA
MKIVIQEALGYTAVAAFALCVDIGILWVLVHYFSWWYLAAATVSFFVGLLVGYALSVLLVFKRRRLADRRLEFASFAAIGAVGLVVNATVISIAVNYFELHYLIAKCGAAGFTFVLSFVSRRQLLFVHRS